MRPFRQGDMDGLCGVYSVLNAINTLEYKNNREDYQTTFIAVLKQLYQEKQSLQFLIDGLTTQDISRILRDIILSRFDITYRKPFHSKADVSLSELWDTLFLYLKDDSQRAAIISIEGHYFSHWTTVSSLSQKRLTFFDSGALNWVNRSRCTTTELTAHHTFILYPTTLFLLERTT